jgi:hypothetical protein
MKRSDSDEVRLRGDEGSSRIPSHPGYEEMRAIGPVDSNSKKEAEERGRVRILE